VDAPILFLLRGRTLSAERFDFAGGGPCFDVEGLRACEGLLNRRFAVG
jgi:hypothetical protein